MEQSELISSKFRKKALVIEATPVTLVLQAVASSWSDLPIWLTDAYSLGNVIFLPDCLYIRTLEGEMRGGLGDWIVKGVRGELYPIKGDIFDETYEAANE